MSEGGAHAGGGWGEVTVWIGLGDGEGMAGIRLIGVSQNVATPSQDQAEVESLPPNISTSSKYLLPSKAGI